MIFEHDIIIELRAHKWIAFCVVHKCCLITILYATTTTAKHVNNTFFSVEFSAWKELLVFFLLAIVSSLNKKCAFLLTRIVEQTTHKFENHSVFILSTTTRQNDMRQRNRHLFVSLTLNKCMIHTRTVLSTRTHIPWVFPHYYQFKWKIHLGEFSHNVQISNWLCFGSFLCWFIKCWMKWNEMNKYLNCMSLQFHSSPTLPRENTNLSELYSDLGEKKSCFSAFHTAGLIQFISSIRNIPTNNKWAEQSARI